MAGRLACALGLAAAAARASPTSPLAAAPPVEEKAAYARWMTETLTWGFLSTISTRSQATTVGAPFGNPYSFATVKGVPYFYVSDLDASMIDLRTSTSPKPNPRASFAMSAATLTESNGSATVAACGIGSLGDPENPPCARLVLSGSVTKVEPNSTEDASAKAALFSTHPAFKHYPNDHSFYVAKMSIAGIWLINIFGGAAIIKPADYFAAPATGTGASQAKLVDKAPASPRGPPFWKKPETARWMTQSLKWGALSTLSTRSEASNVGDAFGNPYSFADVDGVVYFYASGLDASMIDLFTGTNASARASFTLSEATEQADGVMHSQACKIGTFLGDPENPPCARLQLSGTVSKLAVNSSEEVVAKAALFARHPSFASYPAGHAFYVAKLSIDGVWLVAMYGGPGIISPEEYFKANPDSQILVV